MTAASSLRRAERSEASPSARIARLILVALTLGAFTLRLGLLAVYPLREDEAIYAFWARRWLDGDTLFLHVWPDKPPLFLWLLAGLYSLAGGAPAADAALGRWLNIAAGTLTIPVVGLAARRLWGSRAAGAGAALLIALSPFAVSFSPTLYTDPVLVLWGSAAVAAALSQRPGWAGVLLGAAIMTKQQGVLYAPLVLALAALPLDRRAWPRLGRTFVGLALVTLPILWWDSLRWTIAPSPWALSASTYAPLALAPPATWGPRLAAWSELLWYLAAAWPVWGLLLAAVAVAVLTQARCDLRLALILGWGVAFVAAHVFTTVQVWDRYLLPLAPWLAWVASGPFARALAAVGRLSFPVLGRSGGFHTADPSCHTRRAVWKPHLQVLSFRAPRLSFRTEGEESLGSGSASPQNQRDSSSQTGSPWARNDRIHTWVSLVILAALLLLFPPALTAAAGGYPLGGDHGDYAGLETALAWLDAANDRGPYVLYHQPLGWQYRFYLYNDLPRDGDTAPARVDLRWFPSAAYLADNAAKTAYPPKYLVVPDWSSPRDLDLHLAQRGLAAATRLRAGRMTVLEIVHTPQPPCAWCITRAPWTPRPGVSPSSAPARICLP